MEVVNAIKKFNKSIEDLVEATKTIRKLTNQGKMIDETVKQQIEQSKKEAEELLKKIRF